MALYKSHSITLDTKRTPKIALQNIVVGETGNKLTVTLKNDGSAVSLNGNDYRVCLRVDSAKGVVRQDSSLPNSGITFSNGKVIIMLSRDSFAASLNRCRLEIFSTETDTDDILICSSEFQFTAASNDTGENAGEVYPSLIIAEQEARQATEDANNAASAASAAATSANTAASNANNAASAADAAASAANTAASSANAASASANSAANAASAATEAINELLDSIDDTPTENSDNLVTSGGVYSALTGKQDTLTFDDTPTLNSANPVKSGGVFSAIASERSYRGDIVTLVSHPVGTYHPGYYWIYKGEDTTLNGFLLKNGDLILCMQEKSGNFNSWEDFTVIAGVEHVESNDSFAPMVLRIVPQWGAQVLGPASSYAKQITITGATIAEIVAAHTGNAPRAILACVVGEQDDNLWVMETSFSFYNSFLAINVSGVDKEISFVSGVFIIDTSTNTITNDTELGYYEV